MITRILQSISHNPRAWLEVGPGGRATVFVLHRGVSKAEHAAFGRSVRGGSLPVLVQQPAELAGMDLAIWETQRCAVPLLGFSIQHDDAAANLSSTWLGAEQGKPVFAAGLCSVNEQPGAGGSGFSILVARSTQAPAWRPLYVSGISVDEWLRLPGTEAMSWLRSDWSNPHLLQPAMRHGPSANWPDGMVLPA